LVTLVLFGHAHTDVLVHRHRGSTPLLERLGHDVYARLLTDHHRLIRSRLAAHGGREVDTQGDGFFAVFTSPTAALAAVVEMQRAVIDHGWPGGERVRVRMGLHAGEAEETDTGLVGLEVHRAARVAALANGSQILLSEAAAVLMRGSLPAEMTIVDLGVHRLKGLELPERIFQVDGPGLDVEFPHLPSMDELRSRGRLPPKLSASSVARPNWSDWSSCWAATG
jgi:class 3 adenylate cyclase